MGEVDGIIKAVDVFLDSESSKRPSPSAKKPKASGNLVKLRKNVMKMQRFTMRSLRRKEKELPDFVASDEAPTVSTETVENARDSLAIEGLDAALNSLQTSESRNHIEDRLESLKSRQKDSSYRSELLTCEATKLDPVNDTSADKLSFTNQKDQVELDPASRSEYEDTIGGLFSAIGSSVESDVFQSARTMYPMNSILEECEEDESEDEESVVEEGKDEKPIVEEHLSKPVVGTCADDFDCQPHVMRSLRPEEKELLDFMASDDEVSSTVKCESRPSLRKSIASSKSLLSTSELEYLTKLTEAPNVSTETVENARDSLAIEGLDVVLNSLQTSESQNNIESRRNSLDSRQKDASYRAELWTYEATKLDPVNDTSADKLSFTSQRDKVELDPVSRNENEDSIGGLFSKIGNSVDSDVFQSARTMGTMDSIMEECDDEESEDEESVVEEYKDIRPVVQEPLSNTILGTYADDFDCQPHVMSPPIMDALRSHLPDVLREDNFWLKYSLLRDGSSMRCLLSNIRSSSSTILAIETFEGDVFGAFVSSPWRPHGLKYFGSSEAFLWRMKQSRFTPCNSVKAQVELESDVEVFPCNSENHHVQRLETAEAHLMIGGGGPDDGSEGNEAEFGPGLMLSNNLEDGVSHPCLTFCSPSLPVSTDETFEIANLEVWTLTPVDTIDQAEKVELGRRFVFDQDNFAED